MLAGGMGRGGGFRGGGGAHYGRGDNNRGGRRARGGGKGAGKGSGKGTGGRGFSTMALTVEVELDDALRGMVIGQRGATVAETQRLTHARISVPKRGEAGPLRIAGPTVGSVLDACSLIARQTNASAHCTCSVPSLGSLAAKLHPTDGQRHLLFEAIGDAGGGAFAAYCLPAMPDTTDEAQLDSIVDDAAFTAGLPPQATWAVEQTGASRQWFVLGIGPGLSVAHAIYLALRERVHAATPTTGVEGLEVELPVLSVVSESASARELQVPQTIKND
jgi:hypothetical protein